MRLNRTALLGATVLLLALPVGLGSGASPAAHAAAPRAAPALSASTGAQQIQHIVIIVLENQALSVVWAHGSYEDYLATTYGNATNYYAACHPSAPNYLAMVSAETYQCGTDNWYNYTTTDLGVRLQQAGLTWANYAENLPSGACSSPGTTSTAMFQTHHVPFLFFANTTANQTFCHQHILPSADFNASVANGTMRNFSFYTPNMCDDGHNGCGGNSSNAQLAAQADAWLRGFLAPMLNHTGPYSSKAEKREIAHTLFIVTWDEATGYNVGFYVPRTNGTNAYLWCQANGAKGDSVCGGQIYTVFVSPYSKGRSFTSLDAPYGICATVEWLFHLPSLGNPSNLDTRAGFPVMKSMFSFPYNRR
jgi:hypothetical protein